MARREIQMTTSPHADSIGFARRNMSTADPNLMRTTTTHYYPTTSLVMNSHTQNVIPTAQMAATPAPPTDESRIDKAYITSIRGLLKFACLIFSFIAFVCLVSTAQCNGNHVFLASVTWLVMIMQVLIILAFVFRLQRRFPAIDFEFVDFFATSHDALYLLIASSVTIHYCRLPGQIAAGVMGIFAFLFLAGDAVTIFLARRVDSNGEGQ